MNLPEGTCVCCSSLVVWVVVFASELVVTAAVVDVVEAVSTVIT